MRNENNKKIEYSAEDKTIMRGGSMRLCHVCKKPGKEKHHIIHGHGKRKACETRESLIDICYGCHRLVHSADGSQINRQLRLELQSLYFEKGYSREEVCRLMGGKLH